MELMRQLLPHEFPPLLGEIPDPPKQLYIEGTLPNFEKNIFLAVVGSRKYSSYGKQAVETLISGLAGFPIVIVSGLALGIDALAHKAALRAGLTTIAIPGSGLEERVLYPATHRQLARQILKAGGALLSEFEPDFKATTWSFPQRNRVMAGMSHAVLVIEASKKSGTLITSRLATEYNRDVFVVPGSIFSKNSEGPHMLLRLGATPITNSFDILEHFGLEAKAKSAKVFENLSPEERGVIEIIESEPMSKDELVRKLNLPAHKTNILLTSLELKGVIKEEMGKVMLR